MFRDFVFSAEKTVRTIVFYTHQPPAVDARH